MKGVLVQDGCDGEIALQMAGYATEDPEGIIDQGTYEMVALALSEKSRKRSTYGEVVVIEGTCAGCDVKLVRELRDDPPQESDSGHNEEHVEQMGQLEEKDRETERQTGLRGTAGSSSIKTMPKGVGSSTSKSKGGRKRRTSVTKYVDGEKVTTVLKSKPKPPPSPRGPTNRAEADEGLCLCLCLCLCLSLSLSLTLSL